MAIGTQSFGGGRGRRYRGGHGALSEMNVVPLVDVVLVLLIIFMLTASVMEFGLEINVPKVDDTRESAQELPVVSVRKNGQLYLGEQGVANINLLGDAIKQRFKTSKSVYVRADKDCSWDTLAQVVSKLGKAKLEVKMVTQPGSR